MLSQIWAVARKEFLILRQRPGQLVVVFIVPVIFVWIFNAAFGSSGTPRAAVYLCVEDDGTAARQASDALRLSENLDLEILDSRAEADRRVGAGQRMAAVIIPAGFSAAVEASQPAAIEIIIDPARQGQAGILTGLVNAALAPLIVDAEVTRGIRQGVDDVLAQQGGAVPDTLRTFLTAALKGVIAGQVQSALNDPQVQIEPVQAAETQTRSTPTLLESLTPGYSLMFVFFLVQTLAVTVLEERNTGTLRRLLSLPVSRAALLAGKTLPYFAVALVQMLFVLAVGHFAFGVGLGRSPLALGLILAAASLTVAAIGLFIAVVARSEGVAGGLTVLIIISMAAAGGAMFPGIRVPGLEWITPHYWAIRGLQNVITRGQGLEGILLPGGVLIALAAVFFTLAALRFRRE